MNEYHDNSLWLTFRLDGMDYCILSDYIESITIPTKIDPVPEASNTFAGITHYSGSALGVVEMRELFGSVNLKTYTEQFSIMKDMHVSWVEDLDRYVKDGGEFTKAVDPHKCKFGLWYDSFYTDNNRLNRLLKKINKPHGRIHQCGAEILDLRAKGGDGSEAKVLEKLAEADTICQEEIIPLLDRLIEIYKTVNRGVLLVVKHDDRHIGFLVDEVRMLVPCKKTTQEPFSSKFKASPFLRQIVVNDGHILLEVDVEKIIGKQIVNL